MTTATNKEEIRASRRGIGSAAGNAKKELKALEKLQGIEGNSQNAIITISVGCGAVSTIICC